MYPDPTGSVWVKTTASNLGFLADVSTYNSATVIFDPGSATPAYTNDQTVPKNLDATGGKAINAGSYYIQYDVTENDTVTYKLFNVIVQVH